MAHSRNRTTSAQRPSLRKTREKKSALFPYPRKEVRQILGDEGQGGDRNAFVPRAEKRHPSKRGKRGDGSFLSKRSIDKKNTGPWSSADRSSVGEKKTGKGRRTTFQEQKGDIGRPKAQRSRVELLLSSPETGPRKREGNGRTSLQNY